MSTSKLLNRKWIVKEPEVFYVFLKKNIKICYMFQEFESFEDYIYLAKNGCTCESEENMESAIQIYKNFDKMDPKAFEMIKESLNCTSILFKLNDEDLFEL